MVSHAGATSTSQPPTRDLQGLSFGPEAQALLHKPVKPQDKVAAECLWCTTYRVSRSQCNRDRRKGQPDAVGSNRMATEPKEDQFLEIDAVTSFE
jgi:hypothetical protein